ncbi:MAG: class I SAM-dependent methyltransferase [Proteobacteria bacterium]|nr:class I SAM-dependent methyltransferase [Pseudomonadota bacterium]
MKTLIPIFSLLLLTTACSPKPESQPSDQPPQVQQEQPPTAAENAAADAPQAPEAEHHAGMVHDPANPPVDCPLRKHGIDPTQMKPFEQIEAYIQFLEREDRKIWQKPEEVVEAMQLKGSERVLDLGAGSGYFSFPISKKLTSGRLFAADVEPEMIRHIHHNAMLKGIQNIEVKLIDSKTPQIPENIDVVFMCDVIHHIADPVTWMTGIVKQLPSGAQFHIIEFKQGDIPNGPPESAKIAPEKLLEIAKSSGLELDRQVNDLLPYQIYYIFKKV